MYVYPLSLLSDSIRIFPLSFIVNFPPSDITVTSFSRLVYIGKDEEEGSVSGYSFVTCLSQPCGKRSSCVSKRSSFSPTITSLVFRVYLERGGNGRMRFGICLFVYFHFIV